jgi:hypothetical protein
MSDCGLSPFECPLCFDCFNGEENLPCVLTCGHSICISHIPALANCPMCRHELARELVTSSKPCYALRDGAILYYKLVDAVAQSSHVEPTSDLPSSSSAETTAVHPSAGAGSDISSLTNMGFNRTSVEAALVVHDGDFSATLDYLLQLGDIDCALGPSPTATVATTTVTATAPTVPVIGSIPPTSVPPRPPAPSGRVSSSERRSGTMGGRVMVTKSCGHYCSPSSVATCCHCSDARPLIPDGTYPSYVDGRGWLNCGRRKDGYCPVCKMHQGV